MLHLAQNYTYISIRIGMYSYIYAYIRIIIRNYLILLNSNLFIIHTWKRKLVDLEGIEPSSISASLIILHVYPNLKSLADLGATWLFRTSHNSTNLLFFNCVRNRRACSVFNQNFCQTGFYYILLPSSSRSACFSLLGCGLHGQI